MGSQIKQVAQSGRELLLALIEVILPERARSARVRTKKIPDFALVPVEHSLLGVRIVTLLDYRDPNVSDLILALKYQHSVRAAELCAEALADYLQEEIASLRVFSSRPILLVPMPLHASRARTRGFNQMERVLSRLPRDLFLGKHCRVSDTALIRIKPTQQQTRLSRIERLQNVADAFKADPSEVKNTHVILIDDVTTTGATFASAAKPLQKAGAIVTLIALARA